MNINVTGDPERDSQMILMQTVRIQTICETLKKRLTDTDDIRLILNLELALLDVKDCAMTIKEVSGEHS